MAGWFISWEIHQTMDDLGVYPVYVGFLKWVIPQ